MPEFYINVYLKNDTTNSASCHLFLQKRRQQCDWMTLTIPFNRYLTVSNSQIKQAIQTYLRSKNIKYKKTKDRLEWKVNLSLEELLVHEHEEVRLFAKRMFVKGSTNAKTEK